MSDVVYRGVDMRKTLPWMIVIGLFVFVGVYAFVFPESQLPVRIRTNKVWQIDHPLGQMLFQSDNFIISKNHIFSYSNNEWVNIGLPPIDSRTELPMGLEWSEPSISMAYADGDVLYVAYSSLKLTGMKTEIAIWDGRWTWRPVGENILKSLKLLTPPEPVSARILELGVKSKISWHSETIEIDTPNITEQWVVHDARIDEYTYRIAGDGRIERIKDDIVTAVSSRDELDPFLIQADIIAGNESIYVLLENRSEMMPRGWVHVLARDLSHKNFIVHRHDHEPVSIALWNRDTLLTLWDDGVLSGYSTWGQEKFSFELCVGQPLDMISTGSMAYVLTDRDLLAVTPTARKAKVDVWPRVITLGTVREPYEFTLFIGSESMPTIQVKGDGVQLDQIMGHENGILATFSVDPHGLPAFSTVSGEILVETQSGHEVVPYSFVPSGSVREFKVFSDMLLDLETGEMLNFEYLGDGNISIDGIPSDTHEVYFDYFSGKVFLVTPRPLSPIDLEVSIIGPQIARS